MTFNLANFQSTHHTGRGLIPVPLSVLTAGQYSTLLPDMWLPGDDVNTLFYKSRQQAQVLQGFLLFPNVHWKWIAGKLIQDYVFPANTLILFPEDASPPCVSFNEAVAANFRASGVITRTSTSPVQINTRITAIPYLEKDLQKNPRLKAYHNWSNGAQMHNWIPEIPISNPMNTFYVPEMSTDNRNQKAQVGFYKEEATAFQEALTNHINCSSKKEPLDFRSSNQWKGCFKKGTQFLDQNLSASLKVYSGMTLEHPHSMGSDFSKVCARALQFANGDFDPETVCFEKLFSRVLCELLNHSHLTINHLYSQIDFNSPLFAQNPHIAKLFKTLRVGQLANLLCADHLFATYMKVHTKEGKYKFTQSPDKNAYFKILKKFMLDFNLTGSTDIKRSDLIQEQPQKFSDLDKPYRDMYEKIIHFKKMSKRGINEIDTSATETRKKRRLFSTTPPEPAPVANNSNSYRNNNQRGQARGATRGRGTRGRGRGSRGRGRGGYQGRWENSYANPQSRNFRGRGGKQF